MQRQLLSRLLAGAAALLAGLLAFPFHGKLTYMLLVGLVGIVGGIVLAVVCMGKKELRKAINQKFYEVVGDQNRVNLILITFSHVVQCNPDRTCP